MPHSVFGRPRQRPARAFLIGRWSLVQGMQPTRQNNPMTRAGCGGSFAARRSPRFIRGKFANGLKYFNLIAGPARDGNGGTKTALETLAPVIHALNGRHQCAGQWFHLADRQQHRDSENHNSRSGSSRASVLLQGLERRK